MLDKIVDLSEKSNSRAMPHIRQIFLQQIASVKHYHRELHLKYDRAQGFVSAVDGTS